MTICDAENAGTAARLDTMPPIWYNKAKGSGRTEPGMTHRAKRGEGGFPMKKSTAILIAAIALLSGVIGGFLLSPIKGGFSGCCSSYRYGENPEHSGKEP